MRTMKTNAVIVCGDFRSSPDHNSRRVCDVAIHVFTDRETTLTIVLPDMGDEALSHFQTALSYYTGGRVSVTGRA